MVGGHGVRLHGNPRFTADIDVVVVPPLENANAVIAALEDFGFGALEISAEELTRPITVALGRAPHQIDVMTFIKGVDIDEAWRDRVEGILDGVEVYFVSKPHLLANKRAVGRPEDLADVARLGDA